MRESPVPTPDVPRLVARERRLTLITGVAVVALIAAAAGFVWNTVLALNEAQRRIETAETAAGVVQAAFARPFSTSPARVRPIASMDFVGPPRGSS